MSALAPLVRRLGTVGPASSQTLTPACAQVICVHAYRPSLQDSRLTGLTGIFQRLLSLLPYFPVTSTLIVRQTIVLMPHLGILLALIHSVDVAAVRRPNLRNSQRLVGSLSQS